MTAIARCSGCAAGLLLLMGACVRTAPETPVQREVVRQAKPPADACQELQRLLAAQSGDATSRSDAEVEEMLRRLAIQRDEPALRACLTRLMTRGPGAPQR